MSSEIWEGEGCPARCPPPSPDTHTNTNTHTHAHSLWPVTCRERSQAWDEESGGARDVESKVSPRGDSNQGHPGALACAASPLGCLDPYDLSTVWDQKKGVWCSSEWFVSTCPKTLWG